MTVTLIVFRHMYMLQFLMAAHLCSHISSVSVAITQEQFSSFKVIMVVRYRSNLLLVYS
jgi:hypothetical protein